MKNITSICACVSGLCLIREYSTEGGIALSYRLAYFIYLLPQKVAYDGKTPSISIDPTTLAASLV